MGKKSLWKNGDYKDDDSAEEVYPVEDYPNYPNEGYYPTEDYYQPEEYPKALKPNESFTAVDSNFMILTSSQYDKVLVKLLELEKANSLIENHELTRAKLDSIIALL